MVDLNSRCNKKIESNSKESRTKPIYIGGDTNMARRNVNEWIKSLEDYTRWSIVEYRDVVSIFEVLGDDLRSRVLNTLGKKILYANVDQRKITFIPNQNPYVHELDIPEKYKKNFVDHQIFATIISEKKGTFSVQVMYTTDESANLLIHQFRKSGKDKWREYSLKIGWIIIGIPNDFEYFEFEDFNDLEELEIKVTTCALKNYANSLEYNPLYLKIITGIHFHHIPDHKSLQMCIYNYDLENKCIINEGLPSNLSVQFWFVYIHYNTI
ncbi:16309_t:CDS:2, partial [Racocetra fulgida]